MSVNTTDSPTTQETDRAPCVTCGGSMVGEHHKRKECSECKPPRGKAKGRAPKPKAAPKPDAAPAKGRVTVKIEDLPPPDEEAETNEYWIGTLETCPIQNVTVGGICFPLFTGTPTLDDKCRVMPEGGSINRGTLIHLSDRQVDFVTTAISTKVVRFHGKEREVYIPAMARGENPEEPKSIMRRLANIVARDEKYEPRHGDEPLAAHLFMYRTDSLGFDAMRGVPESMLEA